VLVLCVVFSLLSAVVPFARAFYRIEISCNEGWDVYNAAVVAAHGQLYPARTGWTTVNYPMVWLALVAQFHRWTHEYLFTARALSLLALLSSCVLVSAIVRSLGAARRPALLAGVFCLALFCVAADFPCFVGIDDPTIPALAIYLAGLWVFLRWGVSRLGLAFSALLFVLAFSTKHNPVEFPLAVFAGLLLVSLRRALWFAACGLTSLAAAIALHFVYGGPYFLRDLLAPRSYSVAKVPLMLGVVWGPLLLPLGVSLYTAYLYRRDPRRRVVAFVLLFGLLMGGYFLGGYGVSINVLFGCFVAMCILLGLFFDRVFSRSQRWVVYAPLALFAWLLIPWLVVPPLDDRAAVQLNWNPPLALEQTAAAEARFEDGVAMLRSQPGPALCESLLRCYFAGKPYIYDPYNATRMIGLGQLDSEVIVSAIRRRQFGAIQLSGPIDDNRRTELFAPPILAAIRENYHSAFEDQDGAIYLPNPVSAAPAGMTAIASAQNVALRTNGTPALNAPSLSLKLLAVRMPDRITPGGISRRGVESGDAHKSKFVGGETGRGGQHAQAVAHAAPEVDR